MLSPKLISVLTATTVLTIAGAAPAAAQTARERALERQRFICEWMPSERRWNDPRCEEAAESLRGPTGAVPGTFAIDEDEEDDDDGEISSGPGNPGNLAPVGNAGETPNNQAQSSWGDTSTEGSGDSFNSDQGVSDATTEPGGSGGSQSNASSAGGGQGGNPNN